VGRLLRLSPGAGRIFLAEHLDPVAEREQETRFFSSLRLHSGVFKSTAVARLEDVDQWLLDFLPSMSPLRILDVAISSGVTTCEWERLLQHEGVDFEMSGSDVCIDAWLISFGSETWPFRVLLDSDGYPLQYEVAGLGLRTASNNAMVDLPFAVLRWLCRLKLLLATFGRGLPDSTEPSSASRRIGLVVVRPVELVTAAIRKGPGVSPEPAIEIFQEDLLAPTPQSQKERYDLIRAANILNAGYFDAATLLQLATRLRERLRDGGRLLIVQTRDGVAATESANDGTLFERSPDGLTIVARYGSGSEIERLVSSSELLSKPSSVPPRDSSQ
jgi:hypothetical protein